MVGGAEGQSADLPRARAVLLGASNLTRGFPVFVDAARQAAGGPIDLLAALGHGRSYGQPSSVLGRRLCGIAESALWDELAGRPPLPVYALITDIGNDIIYGVPAKRLLDWVTHCVDRLAALGARIAVTQLPLDTIRTIGPRKFALLRRVLFPSCGVTLDEAQALAEEVNQAVARLAASRGLKLLAQERTWFGLDPIHIRRRLYPQAAACMLSAWRDEPAGLIPPRASRVRSLYLATRLPHERHLFGIVQRRRQPCCRFPDGTRVSLY